MKVLRTPEARFEGLADYPFPPRYAEVRDPDGGSPLRLHYLDEGPADALPVLLMHGEPSWSYLYRHMIPPLVAAGRRVVAPDLIGFGKSDKPAERADYTYERHVAWMSEWLTGLGLTDITLYCQDWGGLIGLRLVAAFPGRFARIVVANTGLPTGEGMGKGFLAWLNYSQSAPEMHVGGILQGATCRRLTDAEVAAYDAPFPDESFKAGARQFPKLVPITPEHPSVAENRAAWLGLEKFQKPFLTAFSDQDPVTRGGDAAFKARVPGAKGQPHVTIEGAHHFLQEDKPAEIAALVNRFIDA